MSISSSSRKEIFRCRPLKGRRCIPDVVLKNERWKKANKKKYDKY